MEKRVHPVRAVRDAAEVSQAEFAEMFGVSRSYIKAIEIGKRKLGDNLANAIMLRFGIDADSLKKDRRSPVSLIKLDKAGFLYSGSGFARKFRCPADVGKQPRGFEKFRRDLGQAKNELDVLRRDKRAQLSRLISFWQNNVLPSWELDRERVRASLKRKFDVTLEAAAKGSEFYAVAMHLDNCLDAAADEFGLKRAIAGLNRGPLPKFMDTLAPYFWLKGTPRRYVHTTTLRFKLKAPRRVKR
jgi:transcriptional regulator with XRE-family HTH domain